jgi:hypothetical protein
MKRPFGAGLRTAKYWQDRAEEVRARAEEVHDGTARRTLLDIAHRYDQMAKLASEREAQTKRH